MHWLIGALVSVAPERRQCSPSKQPAAKAAPLFCPLRREISPLRSATVEMTIGVPANIVISSGDACRYGADGKRFDDTLSREISQRNAARTIRGRDFSTPLRFGRNDGGALANTVISSGAACRYGEQMENALMILRAEKSPNVMPPIPSGGGDFSTPLRFGRNDERGARQHRHLERGDATVWVLEGNRFDETLSREISQRNAARTIRGGDFSTPQRFRRNDGGRALFL